MYLAPYNITFSSLLANTSEISSMVGSALAMQYSSVISSAAMSLFKTIQEKIGYSTPDNNTNATNKTTKNIDFPEEILPV